MNLEIPVFLTVLGDYGLHWSPYCIDDNIGTPTTNSRAFVGVHVVPPPSHSYHFCVSLLFGILIVSLLENIFRQSHCASTCTIQKQLDILGHQSCLMKLLTHLSLQTGRTTKVYTFGLSYPVDLHVFATTIAFRYNMQIWFHSSNVFIITFSLGHIIDSYSSGYELHYVKVLL